MIEIFQKFIAGDFDESTLLSKAYSEITGIKLEWIVCDDCTIKEQCHRICDKLEAEGHNLDTLPLKFIEEKFADVKFSIDYPPEYLQLIKSLEYVKDQQNKLLNFPHTDGKALQLIENHIFNLEKEIKGYHD